MCDRRLELSERAVLLDGDDAEQVWTWKACAHEAAELERLSDLVRCLAPGEGFEAERRHIERELRRLVQEARE